MKTIQDIKRLPIRDYLDERGLRPTKDNARYGLYLSPLREEHTPSFKVDYTHNLWYDFGLGVGGSIIDLVMRLDKCDLVQAVRLLGSGERTPIAVSVPSSGSPTAPTLRILFDKPLRHPALVGYLSSRGIEPEIASSYCREVYYTIGKREYFAVGFRNDAGGWELRSERFKGSVAQAYCDDRQPFRYGSRIRGLYGFSLIPFYEADRTATHRRRSTELGRQSYESDSVSRKASDD